MAAPLVVTTFERVPEFAQGYVRDLRVRWALEEAGLPYRVESIPFGERRPEHLAHQPFGQVPWLMDGDLSLFETGAILLHLGEHSPRLLPRDPRRRSQAVQWMFASLNSLELAFIPWLMAVFAKDDFTSPGGRSLIAFRDRRLSELEPVLAEREWLAGDFSAADILAADALRVFDRTDILAGYPACAAYLARATTPPPFVKAHADHTAHFARAQG